MIFPAKDVLHYLHITSTMECLAILNRLSIFSDNNGERAELCAALERASEELVPSDIPLAALDEALLLLSDHPADTAIIRCACTFLAACALGDDQTVRRYLFTFTPRKAISTGSDTSSKSPFLVSLINSAMVKGITEFIDSSMSNWKTSVQPLTDLVATLSYNNGALRAAFGASEVGAQSTIVILGQILARVRRELAETQPLTEVANTVSDSPSANVLFYTISCLAVLLTAEPSNVEVALTNDVIAEVLYCYKCVNITGSGASLGAKRPGSAMVSAKGRVDSNTGRFPAPIKYTFINADNKIEINKWSIQALRNAAIAGAKHPAWDGGLDYGRMGEIIAVDELKWELSKLRRKASS